MIFHFAPVQGHTDAPYRHFHKLVYGNDVRYYTPFIRLEQGGIRPRDVKDYSSTLNDGLRLVPQVIFRDVRELTELVALLKKDGVKEIDLNMGCPFPLQTGHGRGAATVGNPELAEAVAKVVSDNEDVKFSVKMRLGFDNPDDWTVLLPLLNEVSLDHITVHPRVARQQYSGEIDFERFGKILQMSKNPIVYNGDLLSPEDITRIEESYSGVKGIMIGRGLLGRPSLISECLDGKEWSREQRLAKMLHFHQLLISHYESVLCGESQLLSKMRPFWEYAEEEIGRKAWKGIKKAGNIAKYNSAVAMIGQDL